MTGYARRGAIHAPKNVIEALIPGMTLVAFIVEIHCVTIPRAVIRITEFILRERVACFPMGRNKLKWRELFLACRTTPKVGGLEVREQLIISTGFDVSRILING